MAEKVVTYDEMQHDGRFFDITFVGEVEKRERVLSPEGPEVSYDVEMVEAVETFEDGRREVIPEGSDLFKTLKKKFGSCWQADDFLN